MIVITNYVKPRWFKHRYPMSFVYYKEKKSPNTFLLQLRKQKAHLQIIFLLSIAFQVMFLFIGITALTISFFFPLSSIKKCIQGFDLLANLEQSTFFTEAISFFGAGGPIYRVLEISQARKYVCVFYHVTWLWVRFALVIAIPDF